MPRYKTNFEDSLISNQRSYWYYVKRLLELGMSMFKWENLPDTVDVRYMEYTLLREGKVVYFRDEVMGDLCLSCAPMGNFDIYGVPVKRRAYSQYNHYQKDLDKSDSVIIYNNYLRTNTMPDLIRFAKRLWDLDCTVDVNARAQKTPVLIECEENQKLTMKNLYKEYDGNSPVIFGKKNADLKLNELNVVKTDAPFVADKVQQLKVEIWNEALTYLGISNLNVQKKERLITDEVTRNLGGTIASRYSRLDMRKFACDDINKMFGTNISVEYNSDADIEKIADIQDASDGTVDGKYTKGGGANV